MARLREVMQSGNMLLPSVTTAYLAIEELQKRGYSVDSLSRTVLTR